MNLLKNTLKALILIIIQIDYSFGSTGDEIQLSFPDIFISGNIEMSDDTNNDILFEHVFMPKNPKIRCSGGKFIESQGECGPDTWVYIEATVTVDSNAALQISNYTIPITPATTTRRAHCVYFDSESLQCSWDSDFILPLELTSTNDITITQQPVNYDNKPSVYDNYSHITGALTYVTSNFNISQYGYTAPLIANAVHFSMKQEIIESNAGIKTRDPVHGNSTLHGVMNANISLLHLESLDVSFDVNTLTSSITKQFSKKGDHELLADFHLFYNGHSCHISPDNANMCGRIMENASATLLCGDENLTTEVIKCNAGNSHCNSNDYSQFAKLYGSWGRINIDTTCAITVLLPYE